MKPNRGIDLLMDMSIWRDYGNTKLEFEEYLVIGVASDVFPIDGRAANTIMFAGRRPTSTWSISTKPVFITPRPPSRMSSICPITSLTISGRAIRTKAKAKIEMVREIRRPAIAFFWLNAGSSASPVGLETEEPFSPFPLFWLLFPSDANPKVEPTRMSSLPLFCP